LRFHRVAFSELQELLFSVALKERDAGKDQDCFTKVVAADADATTVSKEGAVSIVVSMLLDVTLSLSLLHCDISSSPFRPRSI